MDKFKIRPMIDPILHIYDEEDFAADFPLPYSAINREGAKIIRISSVNPDLLDKDIHPVNTAAISFYMSGKRGQAKSDTARRMALMSLKKKGLIP